MRNLLAACLARISLQTAVKSLIALVLLVLLGCAPDEVVLAKIADSEITEAELEQFVARLPKHLRSDAQGTAADREHLESMVDQELLLLEARSRGLDTAAALVQQMEDAVRRRLSMRYQREVIASKIDIGPKEIERAFRDMGFDRERLLNRIVVGGSQRDAQAVLEQLEAGREFSDLAREHSANDAKADSNGAIGWIGLTQLKHFLIPQREFLSLPVDKPALMRLSPGAYQIIQFAADRGGPAPNLPRGDSQTTSHGAVVAPHRRGGRTPRPSARRPVPCARGAGVDPTRRETPERVVGGTSEATPFHVCRRKALLQRLTS